MTITNNQLQQIKNSTLLRELEERMLRGEIRINYLTLFECRKCHHQPMSDLISYDFEDEYFLDLNKVSQEYQNLSRELENKNHEPK